MFNFFGAKDNNQNAIFKKEIESKIEDALRDAILDAIADGNVEMTGNPLTKAAFIKDTIVNINKHLKLDIYSKENGISKYKIDAINEVTRKLLRKHLEKIM